MKKNKFTHKDLIDISYKWVLKNGSCGISFRDIRHSGSSEIVDVLGLGSGDHSVLIEVKVSRSDFLADKKKIFRQHPEFGIGLYRFYCCPQGLIKKEEIPEKWGLLYVLENGKIEEVINPLRHRYDLDDDNNFKWRFVERNSDAERSIMYSILRRLQVKGQLKDY